MLKYFGNREIVFVREITKIHETVFKTTLKDAIDYYEVPLPETFKNGFSKTRPFRKQHIESAQEWYFNRDNNDVNAYTVSKEEVINRNYNLDVKNPIKLEEEEVFTLPELMERLDSNSTEIQSLIHELQDVLKQGDV